MKKITLLLIFFTIFINAFGQKKSSPSSVKNGTYLGKTIKLSDAPTIKNTENPGVNEIIVNTNDFSLVQTELSDHTSFLESRQREMGPLLLNTITTNFVGATIIESGITPPDPTGAVGPNHYVHAVNTTIKIFDKEGNLITGPVDLGSFMGSEGFGGDPIVMYDQFADRWFLSQFGDANNSLVIGISETNDPTGAYNVYEYVFDAFPDYPHYSVWPNGYYLTINEGGGGPNPNRQVYVLDRDALLANNNNPQIVGFQLEGQISNPNALYSAGISNFLGTNPIDNMSGFVVYMQDDAWSDQIDIDHLKVWEITIDWEDTDMSTISAPQEIPLEPFDTVFVNGTGLVNQPNTDQDLISIGGVISYASNYRRFENHNSLLITFNVGVDEDETYGIRWVELRNDPTNTFWNLHQEGTYAPDDGHSRFMSSSAIDRFGNIGLAFNIGSASMPIGIHYTGRYENDPLGLMTINENVIYDGEGVQTFSNRFGDYAHMAMDIDDLTFWHTAQYFESNNSFATRVASFQLTGGFQNDVGVTDFISPIEGGNLSDSETVEVTIRNFGTEVQSNFPIELIIDDITIATEIVTEVILPFESIHYVFNENVDLSIENQTYLIQVQTLLENDESETNNLAELEITHLFSNDIGVEAITSPVQGPALSLSDVTVFIKNFGGSIQSNFDVQYSLNNNAPIIETFTGNIMPQESIEYTFVNQVDLSDVVEYTLTTKTSLNNDADLTNDEISTTLLNVCSPTSIGCFFDGIKRFVLNTIDVGDGENGCNSDLNGLLRGYSNRTDLSTNLYNVVGENDYIIKAQQNRGNGPGVSALSAWIDFNDNGDFETSEQLIIGEFFEEFGVLEDFNLIIPEGSTPGSHILRVKSMDTSSSGDVNNPCLNSQFGEVQDYTVIIEDTLTISESQFLNSDLYITTLDNQKFDVLLNSNFKQNISITVYDILGKELIYKPIPREDKGYKIKLDMSNVASGIYIIKVNSTDANTYKISKILVK